MSDIVFPSDPFSLGPDSLESEGLGRQPPEDYYIEHELEALAEDVLGIPNFRSQQGDAQGKLQLRPAAVWRALVLAYEAGRALPIDYDEDRSVIEFFHHRLRMFNAAEQRASEAQHRLTQERSMFEVALRFVFSGHRDIFKGLIPDDKLMPALTHLRVSRASVYGEVFCVDLEPIFHGYAPKSKPFSVTLPVRYLDEDWREAMEADAGILRAMKGAT